jgi:hypothetical protein
MTVAAMQMALMMAWVQRSYRVAMRRKVGGGSGKLNRGYEWIVRATSA